MNILGGMLGALNPVNLLTNVIGGAISNAISGGSEAKAPQAGSAMAYDAGAKPGQGKSAGMEF